MRVLLLSVLIAVLWGCGDDGDDGDGAGRDAGGSVAGARAAAGTTSDAQVRDADLGNAGDASMCDVERGFQPFGADARGERISLESFCKRATCPADWSDALARVGGDEDAGFWGCYIAVTGCGVDTLILNVLTHGMQWNFDHATGQLIGASNVYSDILEGPCNTNEYHAGRNRPDCANETSRVLPGQECSGDDEDAGL